MKSWLKTLSIIIGVVIIAVAVFFGSEYYRYRKSPDYVTEQYFKQLEEAYKNDTYGGSTPEETLQLFIDALKKGDTDLAVRYFVIDQQDKWKLDLAESKKNNNLGLIIQYLENHGPASKISDNSYQFIANDKSKNIVVIVDLVFNLSSKKWKIERF